MKILPFLLEWDRGATNSSGDYGGNDFFIGGPWGFGSNKQLSHKQDWEGLKDSEQEEQDQYSRVDYEDYYNRPQLNKLNNEAALSDPARSMYRDLPGMKHNLLAMPKKHVPSDMDPKRDFPEENHNRPKLTPDGLDDKRPDYWPPNEPLNPLDPIGEQQLRLAAISNPSINDPKTTTQANRGYAERSVKTNQLVSKGPLQPPGAFVALDDPSDVVLPSSSLGRTTKPYRFTPMNDKSGYIQRMVDEAVAEAMSEDD